MNHPVVCGGTLKFSGYIGEADFLVNILNFDFFLGGGGRGGQKI